MSIELRYRLSYTGGDAENNLLPAHEGTQSLEGMGWSMHVLANYLASGHLKRRGALDPRIKVYISPAGRGSFINDIIVFISEPNNIFLTTILGTHAVSTVGGAVNTFIVQSLRHVAGIVFAPTQQEKSWLDRFPSGDLEASLDAIEPAVKRAHGVVGIGATELTITKGRTPLLTFDSETKAYVNANIEGDSVIELEVSVGALNVNSGNGRIYLPEIGKTVPFSIIRELDSGTYQALSFSLDAYARGLTNHVLIRCREYFAHDGRVKKLVIYGARRVVTPPPLVPKP